MITKPFFLGIFGTFHLYILLKTNDYKMRLHLVLKVY